MADRIPCQSCEHCDINRRNGIYIRCTKYSKWVHPNDTCKNADDKFLRSLYKELKKEGLI